MDLLEKLMAESKFLQNSHDLTPQEDRGEQITQCVMYLRGELAQRSGELHASFLTSSPGGNRPTVVETKK